MMNNEKADEESTKRKLIPNRIIIKDNIEKLNILNNMNFHNTPNFNKNKSKIMEVEMEMRRTYKMKPPLISSKFPAAFEITKILNTNKKKLSGNEYEGINTSIIYEKNEDEIVDKSSYIGKKSYDKYNLEPIKLKTIRKGQNIKQVIEQELKKLENDKVDESQTMRKTKLILKPIEIRKQLQPTPIQKEISVEESSEIQNKLFEKNFAKTSNFNFKLLENIEFDENDHHQISQLERNLNMKPGQIINHISKFKNFSVEKKEKSYDINKSLIEKVFYTGNNIIDNEEKNKMRNSNIGFINSIYKLKLDEMITLKMVSTSKTCGNIKIVLHGPSMKIYTIREIPLISKEIRNSLRDLLKVWEEKLTDNKYMLEIYSHYMNIPEGYHSIVMNYCSHGSLENLISSMGMISENILKQITYRVINALEVYYLKTGEVYGSLSLSNILFDHKCNVQLTPGLKHLFSKYNERAIKDKFIYFDIKMRNKLKILWTNHIEQMYPKYDKNLNSRQISFTSLKYNKILKQIEIFDLGFLLINCALGGIEVFDLSQYVCEHSFNINNNENSCCCFYHCIKKYEFNSNSKFKVTNLLENTNTSEDFIDFICLLTSYKYEKNFSMNKIKNHKWITTKLKEDSVLVNLNELLTLSKGFNHQNDLKMNNNKPLMSLEKLYESLFLILPSNMKYLKHNKISDSDQLFNSESDLNELSMLLEIEKETIINKIKPLFTSVLLK